MTEDSKPAWKLVPVEPTEDMTAAAQEAIDSPFYADIESVYRVMVSAAPVNASRSGEDELRVELAILRRTIRATHGPAVVHDNCYDNGMNCPICDGGLYQCSICGAAEAEADERVCTPRPSELVAALREVRSHFNVNYWRGDGTPSVSHRSDALPKVIEIIDAALATPGLAASRPTVGVPTESGKPFPGDDLDQLLSVLETIEYVAHNDIKADGMKSIWDFARYAKDILPRIRSALTPIEGV